MATLITAGILQPGFRIGKFVLRDGIGGAAKVYIEKAGGEGGDFSAEKLEELIEAHYTENF